MSDDSFSPASYDVGRQDLENDLAESGAQFDPLEFPAGIVSVSRCACTTRSDVLT